MHGLRAENHTQAAFAEGVPGIRTAPAMESEREDRRGILRLGYVVVTIGGVCCRERFQADVKREMSAREDSSKDSAQLSDYSCETLVPDSDGQTQRLACQDRAE
jgi:hypothetical protein